MSERPMPDWMMQYVSHIATEECYKNFRELSKDYYTELDKENIIAKPALKLEMLNTNRVAKHEISKAEAEYQKFSITEKYKEKASYLAQTYGCHRPDYQEAIYYKTDEMRNNNPQGQYISHEDPIAKKAIENYRRRFPERAEKSQENFTKFRNKELKEIDASKYSTNEFNKSQDRFDALRNFQNKSFDDIAANLREKLNANNREITQQPKAEASENKIIDNIVESVKDIEGASDDKKDDKDNIDNKDKLADDDNAKYKMSDSYFKKEGITINRSDGDKANPVASKSVSYSGGRQQENTPDKSKSLGKE